MIRTAFARALVAAGATLFLMSLYVVANAATPAPTPVITPAVASVTPSVTPADVANYPFPVSEQGIQVMEQSDERLHVLMKYTKQYRVTSTIAGAIYDNAVTYKIPMDLAFRLVRVESEFNPAAVSNKNAIGLSQLLVGTAREYDPTVTREDLLDPNTNLRIGFHYLRDLIRYYHGDLSMALEAYNRGSDAVDAALSRGSDVTGAYSQTVLAATLR